MEQDPKQKDTNTQKDTAKGHAGLLPHNGPTSRCDHAEKIKFVPNPRVMTRKLWSRERWSDFQVQNPPN